MPGKDRGFGMIIRISVLCPPPPPLPHPHTHILRVIDIERFLFVTSLTKTMFFFFKLLHCKGKVMPSPSQPYALQTPSMKPSMTSGMHKYSPSPSTGYSGHYSFFIHIYIKIFYLLSFMFYNYTCNPKVIQWAKLFP